jgi:hypothetical protein
VVLVLAAVLATIEVGADFGVETIGPPVPRRG